MTYIQFTLLSIGIVYFIVYLVILFGITQSMTHLYIGEQLDSTLVKLIGVYVMIGSVIYTLILLPIISLFMKIQITHIMYTWLVSLVMLGIVLLMIKFVANPLPIQQDIVEKITKQRINLTKLDKTYLSIKRIVVVTIILVILLITRYCISINTIVMSQEKELYTVFSALVFTIQIMVVISIVALIVFSRINKYLKKFYDENSIKE